MAGKKARRQDKQQDKHKSDSTQLLVTFSNPTGDVLKIEKVDKSGRHHDLTAEELAELTGDDKIGDLENALEAAYTEGVKDALDDAILDEKYLSRGVRDLVLRRALGRTSTKRRPRPGTNGNGAHETG